MLNFVQAGSGDVQILEPSHKPEMKQPGRQKLDRLPQLGRGQPLQKTRSPRRDAFGKPPPLHDHVESFRGDDAASPALRSKDERADILTVAAEG